MITYVMTDDNGVRIMVTAEISMPNGITRKDGLVETVLAKIDQYELIRELGGEGACSASRKGGLVCFRRNATEAKGARG